MKISIRKILLCLVLLSAASIAFGASVPAMDVVVTNASGKVAYKGTTSANGTFATGNLPPGDYVVLFNSKAAKGGKYALSVSAGKYSVSSDSVEGARFADAGVAMKVKVLAATKMTGQVGPAGSLAKAAAAQPAAAVNNPNLAGKKTKVMNGKTYVWVTENTSSIGGGHWVEADAAEVQGTSGAKVAPGSQPRSSNPSGMHGGY